MESAAAFADAEGAAPRMTTMSEGEEERFAALFGIAQECVTADDLRLLLRGKPYPVCYDGFEPSGRMHIAQVLVDHADFLKEPH